MITLDPIQALALRKSAVEPVEIAGLSGTGKSTLANAIASQSSHSGKSCLLIGSSRILDRAVAYRVLGEIHRVVADRAQLDHPLGSYKPQHPEILQGDPVEARARANPSAALVAMRTLQRARELSAAHDLKPSEVEESVVTDRPEAANFASLAVQDAARIADVLWSGNGRAGRTFKDVDEAITGHVVEVPPNEDALGLILASDQEYEASLTKIVSSHKESQEEHVISQAVASLLRPRSSDRSLSEYHKHASFMARTIGSAIALIKRHGTLKAAIAAGNGTDAAKAIEYFVRMKPEQGAGVAVKTFEAALQDYRHDSGVLEPLLAEHGQKTLGSFTSAPAPRDNQPGQDIGVLIQKLREARYAARHLPAHLAALRTSLRKQQFERIFNAPIEEAFSILESGSPDSRSKAANDLRQLRDLFASTGFGDLFSAPEDFSERVGRTPAPPETSALVPQSYSPEVLDLLLDLTTFIERHDAAEWPTSVRRARTAQEVADAISRGSRFDVIVIDDVSEYPSDLVRALESSGTKVHRVGVSHHDTAVLLEIPHRQSDAEIAAAVSGQANRWLGAPDTVGIVVRTDPTLELAKLTSAADRLVSEMRRSGCAVAPASAAQEADVIVASVDELRDTDVSALAEKARQGIVILCRSDRRSPTPELDADLAPDIKSAESLGWSVSDTAIDGTVLEKGGQSVALIREPLALSPRDETVADVASRLTALGWRPVVLWRGAERAPDDLENLLTAHAAPTTGNRFRKIAETFSLADPAPPGGDGPKPGIDDGVQPTAEVLQESVTGAGAAPELEQMGGGVSTRALLDTTTIEDNSLPAAGSDYKDQDFRQQIEDTVVQPTPVLEIRTEDTSTPDPEKALYMLGAVCSAADAERPQAFSSLPPGCGVAGEANNPQDGVSQEEGQDGVGHGEVTAGICPEDEIDAESDPASIIELAPDATESSGTVPSKAPPVTTAIFRDRRGARRAAVVSPGVERRREKTGRLRQAEAKFRLAIDPIQRQIHLTAILLRPEGFPEEIAVAESGSPTPAFDLTRYDDIEVDWTSEVLNGEFRLRDGTQGLEWLRSARRFQIFAATAGEPELVTVSAAALRSENTIVCREEDVGTIEAVATEAGSPALRRIAGFHGVPAGWAVLGGYVPVRAMATPPEWLKPLDPGAQIQISFSDGFKIRGATYAQGEPPRILIEGMPSNCEVLLDRIPAEKLEDGSWSAPGWDTPGKHLVDIDPGPSQSYEIVSDPAYGAGWDSWSAHEYLVPQVAGAAAICGAIVISPHGHTVLATEPASSVVALGSQHQVQALALRHDAPAAISVLPFEPLFVIISSGGRRANGKILVLNFPAATSEQKPQKFDQRWASTIRHLAARRIPIRPETPAANAAWQSATREARRWRRGR